MSMPMILYKNFIIKRSITPDDKLDLYVFSKDADQFYHAQITKEEMKEICAYFSLEHMISVIDACCVDYKDNCNLDIKKEKDNVTLTFSIKESFFPIVFSINVPLKTKTPNDEVNLALSEFTKRLDELGVKSELVDLSICKLKQDVDISYQKHLDEMKTLIHQFKREMNTKAYLLRPSEITLPDCLARIPIDIKRLILDGGARSASNMVGSIQFHGVMIFDSLYNVRTYGEGGSANAPYRWVKCPYAIGTSTGFCECHKSQKGYIYITDQSGHSDDFYRHPRDITMPRLTATTSFNFQVNEMLSLPFSSRWFDPSKVAEKGYPVVSFTHSDIKPLALLEDLEDLEIHNNGSIKNWTPVYDLNLKNLALNNCQITDDEFANMLEHSVWYKCLESLDLTDNKDITDLRTIAQMPKLKRLCYRGTGVKNDVCLGNYPHIEIVK